MTKKNINMKLITILLAVIFCMTTAYSQNTSSNIINENPTDIQTQIKCESHRLFIDFATGYSNNIYGNIDRLFVQNKYSSNSTLEFRYAYFFVPKWGISLGVGIACFSAKSLLNIQGVISHYDDPQFDPAGVRFYDLHYKTNNLIEKQQILALEVPLQFHFEHHFPNKHGITASLGAKGYFPVIIAQSIFPQNKGTLTTSGYEAFSDTWYTDPPHFGKQEMSAMPAPAKLRIGVEAIGEFGGVIHLCNKSDLFLGIYGSYGFLDILPKNEEKKEFINPENNNLDKINSPLASNFLSEYNKYVKINNLEWKKTSEKWNRWQIGIKVGIHLKPCCKYENDHKSLRDLKKDYYRNKKNEEQKVVILRDTTIQTIYIYNVPPANYKEDKNLTTHEVENIDALVSLLSNGKILFDIDSDVPKVDNPAFIADVAKILQKEPSLRLVIEGYACDLGAEKYNRDLATRRAEAIRDMFLKQSVNASQIETVAYTAIDPESKVNIKNKNREEHRAVIFKIVKVK
jgi:outer membrane protein OmpA-like peptidoglycan-associated protein